MFKTLSQELAKGASGFSWLTPGIPWLFKPRWIKSILIAKPIISGVINIFHGADPAAVIGENAGYFVFSKISYHPKRLSMKAFQTARTREILWSGLGATRRTWIDETDIGPDNRIVKPMVVMFHWANKAGKHLDVHLGHLSLIYRISGKPVEKKLKFHQRQLTQESKDLLIKHLRKEIANSSRVPWNHDHSLANAKARWNLNTDMVNEKWYGAGPTRQIVLEDQVEFMNHGQSLRFFAPAINPDQGMYIHQLYPGEGNKVPILVCGNLVSQDTNFKDRLHLKMIQEADFKEKFIERVDNESTTRKYDGASAYFRRVRGAEENRFSFFSPRRSKDTNKRIEYSYKLPEMLSAPAGLNAVGLGELLFKRRTWLGSFGNAFLQCNLPEGIGWKFLHAAEIGGILNANKIRPRWALPDFRIYRMDRWQGKNVYNLPFWENRALQLELIKQLPDEWDIVRLVRPRVNKSWEGLVAVPEGMSINDAFKVKWWADAQDWEVTSVELEITKKGNIGGVVWFKSLESGKEFKLGPGQLGDVDRCLEFLNHPRKFEGTVWKVHSRRGHEGRAAKVVDEHLDKGVK